jgi:hypothetical protein
LPSVCILLSVLHYIALNDPIQSFAVSDITIMGKSQTPDEKTVFLALKSVFKGPNAEIRQTKAVRNKLIEQAQAISEVQRLIELYGVDSVCDVARSLLCEKVFKSDLEAKKRFPEGFELPPAPASSSHVAKAKTAGGESKKHDVDPQVSRESGTNDRPGATNAAGSHTGNSMPACSDDQFAITLPS